MTMTFYPFLIQNFPKKKKLHMKGRTRSWLASCFVFWKNLMHILISARMQVGDKTCDVARWLVQTHHRIPRTPAPLHPRALPGLTRRFCWWNLKWTMKAITGNESSPLKGNILKAHSFSQGAKWKSVSHVHLCRVCCHDGCSTHVFHETFLIKSASHSFFLFFFYVEEPFLFSFTLN